MNEYTLIILLAAANPSKDISRARKLILRKKEEPESVERSFQSDRAKSILFSKNTSVVKLQTLIPSVIFHPLILESKI
jgi:hypothetical protein